MLVRVGLKNAIDWQRYGMSVVADVPDGQAAWAMYQKYAPDVVITDLKMPLMDGMALIANIREQDLSTKIIILTCVEDFELARKALAHNVSDYILKLEMTTSQIDRVLGKVQEELQSSRSAPGPLHISEQHVVKEILFKDFLFCNRYTPEEFAVKAEQIGMRLQPVRLMMCLMDIDQYWKLRHRFKDEKGQLIRMSLLNALDEVMRGYEYGEVFHDEEHRYVFLCSYPDTFSEQRCHEKMRQMIEHIRKVMNMYFNVTVSFAISAIHNGYDKLKHQYAQSVHALEDKFFCAPGMHTAFQASHASKIPRPLQHEMIQMADRWEVNDQTKKALTAKIAEVLSKDAEVSRQVIQQHFIQWVGWSINTMHMPHDERAERFTACSEKIMNAETLTDIIALFALHLEQLSRWQTQKRQVSRTVSRILQIIETSYERDISLDELADQVNISPNYLSSLFKKEMQQNFADYLVHYRIEKSKELLLGTYLKFSEVAYQSGFTNHSYFSRTFKRITGVSPREFRRQWIIEGREEREDD